MTISVNNVHLFKSKCKFTVACLRCPGKRFLLSNCMTAQCVSAVLLKAPAYKRLVLVLHGLMFFKVFGSVLFSPGLWGLIKMANVFLCTQVNPFTLKAYIPRLTITKNVFHVHPLWKVVLFHLLLFAFVMFT